VFDQDCAADEYVLLPIGRIDSVSISPGGLVKFEVFRILKGSLRASFKFVQFRPHLSDSPDLFEYLTCHNADTLVELLSEHMLEGFVNKEK
jgi:hypothetical protein